LEFEDSAARLRPQDPANPSDGVSFSADFLAQQVKDFGERYIGLE